MHLVPRVKSLCAFALGARMNAQHDVVLYHTQSGHLYPIWRMDRTIRNLRGPLASEPFAYESRELSSESPVDSPVAVEGLVIRLGANDPLPVVRRWRDAACPEAVLRCLTRRARELSPEEPRDWLRAAAEIAHAIKLSAATRIHLFVDGRAVLALMAGDAIGPWATQIHLMHYVPTGGGNYESVMTANAPAHR